MAKGSANLATAGVEKSATRHCGQDGYLKCGLDVLDKGIWPPSCLHPSIVYEVCCVLAFEGASFRYVILYLGEESISTDWHGRAGLGGRRTGRRQERESCRVQHDGS